MICPIQDPGDDESESESDSSDMELWQRSGNWFPPTLPHMHVLSHIVEVQSVIAPASQAVTI